MQKMENEENMQKKAWNRFDLTIYSVLKKIRNMRNIV